MRLWLNDILYYFEQASGVFFKFFEFLGWRLFEVMQQLFFKKTYVHKMLTAGSVTNIKLVQTNFNDIDYVIME